MMSKRHAISGLSIDGQGSCVRRVLLLEGAYGTASVVVGLLEALVGYDSGSNV